MYNHMSNDTHFPHLPILGPHSFKKILQYI